VVQSFLWEHVSLRSRYLATVVVCLLIPWSLSSSGRFLYGHYLATGLHPTLWIPHPLVPSSLLDSNIHLRISSSDTLNLCSLCTMVHQTSHELYIWFFNFFIVRRIFWCAIMWSHENQLHLPCSCGNFSDTWVKHVAESKRTGAWHNFVPYCRLWQETDCINCEGVVSPEARFYFK
jgi:hypothetical protein